MKRERGGRNTGIEKKTMEKYGERNGYRYENSLKAVSPLASAFMSKYDVAVSLVT